MFFGLVLSNIIVGYFFVIGINNLIDKKDERHKLHKPEDYFRGDYWNKAQMFPDFLKIKMQIPFDKIKQIWIKGFSGIKLNTAYLLSPGSKKWVILLHGWKQNKYSMLHWVNYYHARKVNILMYDARRHGQSEGKQCSMGFYEKFDLGRIIKWFHHEYEYEQLILHGQSMGAATIVQCLKEDAFLIQKKMQSKIYLILDSCYSYLMKSLNASAKIYCQGLPSWFYQWGIKWMVQWNFHYQVNKMNPIDHLEKLAIYPALFIFSNKDRLISFSDAEKIYHNKILNERQHISKFCFIPNVPHIMGYAGNTKKIETSVSRFLNLRPLTSDCEKN